MRPADRLAEAGLVLPEVPAPVAAYVPAVRSGSQVITSGQLPFVSGRLETTGALGAGVDVETGARAARIAVLNALAAATQVAGELNAITRVVRLVVYVAATPDFTQHPVVANGASELLGQLFEGGHVRSAVGVASLPLGAPVEVELVVDAPLEPQVIAL